MKSTIRIIAQLDVQETKVQAATVVLSTLVAATKQEAGCVSYTLLQSESVPTQFIFVEEWLDEDALMQHNASAHMAQAFADITPLLAKAPKIERYALV